MEGHLIGPSEKAKSETKKAAPAATQPATYTKAQVEEAFKEGQKSGFLSAIKQMRTLINNHLDDFILSINK